MALLYKAQCKDFVNGITVDKVSAMTKSPDIHHIFPQKYCIDHGIARQKWNSIVNKTPLLLESNRAIGGNAPSQYIPKILSRNKDLTEDVRYEILQYINSLLIEQRNFFLLLTKLWGKKWRIVILIIRLSSLELVWHKRQPLKWGTPLPL